MPQQVCCGSFTMEVHWTSIATHRSVGVVSSIVSDFSGCFVFGAYHAAESFQQFLHYGGPLDLHCYAPFSQVVMFQDSTFVAVLAG